MYTYVALLRGINVGGRVITMQDLTSCFMNAGLQNVRSVIQSGNVLFASDSKDSQQIREKIEQAVSKQFSYEAKIFVDTIEHLTKIVEAYPYDTAEENWQHYVLFIDAALAEQLAAEAAELDPEVDSISLGDRVLYWRVIKGATLKSPFAKLLTKTKYRAHTNRNIKTLKKIIRA